MRFIVLLAVISSPLLCNAAPYAYPYANPYANPYAYSLAYPFAFNPVAPFQAMANTGFEAGLGVVNTGLAGLQAGTNVGLNTLAAMGTYLNPMNMIQAGTQALGYSSSLGLQSIGAGLTGAATGLTGVATGLTGVGTGLTGVGTGLTGVTNGYGLGAFSDVTSGAVSSGVDALDAVTTTATNAATATLESALTN